MPSKPPIDARSMDDTMLLLTDIVFAAAIGIGFEHFPGPLSHDKWVGLLLFFFTLAFWSNDWLVSHRLFKQSNSSRPSLIFYSTLISALCLSQMLRLACEEDLKQWLVYCGGYLLMGVVWNVFTEFVGRQSQQFNATAEGI